MTLKTTMASMTELVEPVGAGRIVLWRHGQTDDNVALRLQGQTDNPLNAVGEEQARIASAVLARRLREMGGELRLVSSDLVRAVDTARYLADAFAVPVKEDAGLRERAFGPWEGKTFQEIAQQWPHEAAEWRAGRNPGLPGLESRGECARRVGGTLARLAEEAPQGATLVATLHGAAISLAISHLLGKDPDCWAGIRGIDNCHWAVLSRNHSAKPEWALTAYNVGA